MALTDRQISILMYLYGHKNEFTPAKIIADFFKVSVRTINSDLQSIKKNSKNFSSFDLSSSSRKGTKLCINEPKKFKNEISKLQNKQEQKIDSPQKRNNAIIHYLLDSGGYVTKNDLMQSFFISESTLYKEIKSIKKILDQFKLTLKYKTNLGYYITGSETNKRACLNKVSIMGNLVSHSLYESTTKIYNVVADIFIKYKYKVEEQTLQAITSHITQSINRIKKGYYIEKEASPNLTNTLEFKMSVEILNQLLNGYRINKTKLFDEAELISKIMLGKKEDIDNESLYQKINNFIIRAFNLIYERFSINFNSIDNLRLLLVLHLKPLFYRAQSNTQLENPLNSEIHQQFPQAYDIALYFTTILNKEFSIKLSIGETSYLALYFNYGIENYLSFSSNKKILLITSLRNSETILLQHKILKWFPNEIDTIDFTSPTEFKKSQNIQRYDAIFTTETALFDNQGLITPINLFPTEKDFETINLAINGYQGVNNVTSRFNKNCFFYGKINTKREALDLAINNAQKEYGLNSSFKSSIYEREELNSTYFGNGIAIPHPLSPISDKTFVSLVALKDEIKWDSVYNVQFILLVSIAKNNPKEFQFWYYLSTFLQDEHAFNIFKSDPNFENLIIAIEYALSNKLNNN